jgi:hypothetical protein
VALVIAVGDAIAVSLLVTAKTKGASASEVVVSAVIGLLLVSALPG